MNIALLPEQLTFLETKKPIVVYVAGIRAGKTYIACIKAIRKAFEGRTQLMIGLTYSQCRDVILSTLIKIFEAMNMIEKKHYIINKNEMRVDIVGGSKIFIRSAEIGNNLRGITVSDVYIDEAAYLKSDEMYKVAIGRMSENDDAQVHITTSPSGFNWVYDLTQDEDCELINVSTFKNSFIPDEYIKILLKQYSSKFIQQELFGEFITMTGSIFNADWIKEDTISLKYKTSKKVRFWDFAFSDTDNADYSAGVLLSNIGDGRYIIEDVVRVRETYTDLRKTIIETAQRDGREVQIGFELAGQQKGIIADLKSIPELAFYIKKDLNVSRFGNKIKRMLPLASLAENGNLYISPSCKNKIEFKNECNSLTMDDSHAHDDMIDACASAFIMFNHIFDTVRTVKSNIYG